MSKTCKSCGAEYNGEYCTKCGYGNPKIKSSTLEKYKAESAKPVRFMTPEEKEEYYQQLKDKHSRKAPVKRKRKDSKKMLGVVLIVAVVIVGVVLFSSGTISFGNQTATVEKYFQSIEDKDYSSFASCLFSDVKAEYDNDISTLGATEENYMSDYYCVDFNETYGTDFTTTATCGEEEKLDKTQLSEILSESGMSEISSAYSVPVTVQFKGSVSEETVDLVMYLTSENGGYKIFYLEAVEVPYTDAEKSDNTQSSDSFSSQES